MRTPMMMPFHLQYEANPIQFNNKIHLDTIYQKHGPLW